MSAGVVALPLRIGPRTLVSIPRRLRRVPLSLAEALDAAPLVLPPLALPPLTNWEDGYIVTSLAATAQVPAADGLIARVRQRYTRYYVDLTVGREAWLAGLSAGNRATMRRKARRLASSAIARGADPAGLAALLPSMRAVAATTYQARLLGDALPDDATLLARAAADEVRAWVMTIDGTPAAFLLLTAAGDTLIYDHVGHDPRFAALSPGSVLMGHALDDLMAERRFVRLDLTEGEGQHKRQIATAGVACLDLLLLRPTLANRATLATLAGFDGAVALGKRLAAVPVLARAARRVRR